MAKKKPKKPKNKTWIVEAYYYDGKNAYTYVRDPETLKEKRIKGIAWHQNKDDWKLWNEIEC